MTSPPPLGLSDPLKTTTKPTAPIPGPGAHLPALDGLRGLAVMMVVAFHVFQGEPAPAQTIPRLLHMTTRLGQTGVDLFFVLSGFLITGILFDTKGSTRYFRNFYGRRTVRIFPLYYGVLFAVLIVLPRVFGTAGVDIHPAWFWTYTVNLPMSFGIEPNTIGHFWTLAIEEQFYLLWPAVVFAFGRTALMRISLGCIAGALVCRVLAESLGVSSFSFTLCRLDSLTLGAWLALAARGPAGARNWGKIALGAMLAMGLVMAPLYVLKSGGGDARVQVVKYTIIAGFHGAVLVLAFTAAPASWTGRFFTLAPLRSLGRYSYGIYVYHIFAIQALEGRLTAAWLGTLGVPTAAASWARFGAIAAGAIAAAWLSWHLFEKRFLVLKKYFEYAEPKANVRKPGRARRLLTGMETGV